jgi:hypothetical protein
MFCAAPQARKLTLAILGELLRGGKAKVVAVLHDGLELLVNVGLGPPGEGEQRVRSETEERWKRRRTGCAASSVPSRVRKPGGRGKGEEGVERRREERKGGELLRLKRHERREPTYSDTTAL